MFKFLFDIDTWQEVSDSLTKNKIRTIITMIGVWWGILLINRFIRICKRIENKFKLYLEILLLIVFCLVSMN